MRLGLAPIRMAVPPWVSRPPSRTTVVAVVAVVLIILLEAIGQPATPILFEAVMPALVGMLIPPLGLPMAALIMSQDLGARRGPSPADRVPVA